MRYAGLDGDSAMRLIEVSFALHRASVELEGVDSDGLAQSCTGYLPVPGVTGLASDESGIRTTSAVDDIRAARAHFDDVNAIIAAGATAAPSGSLVDTPEVGTEMTKDETDCNPTAVLIPRRYTLEHICDGLNKSVVRGIMEAALILQGALQLDFDPDTVQRIEAAIEVLDETTRQTRNVLEMWSNCPLIDDDCVGEVV